MGASQADIQRPRRQGVPVARDVGSDCLVLVEVEKW